MIRPNPFVECGDLSERRRVTGYIAVSLLCIAGAAVALIFGWFSANEVLVWLSLGLSGLAGILLALAYYRAGRLARRIRSGAAGASK